MKRCRDCYWWRVRKGCVNSAICGHAVGAALIPSKGDIYHRTKCPLFNPKPENDPVA